MSGPRATERYLLRHGDTLYRVTAASAHLATAHVLAFLGDPAIWRGEIEQFTETLYRELHGEPDDVVDVPDVGGDVAGGRAGGRTSRPATIPPGRRTATTKPPARCAGPQRWPRARGRCAASCTVATTRPSRRRTRACAASGSTWPTTSRRTAMRPRATGAGGCRWPATSGRRGDERARP